MAMIAGLVEAAVAPAEAAGMDGDAVEAEAWAYLAVRSLKGLPITFPGTTGVAAAADGRRAGEGVAAHLTRALWAAARTGIYCKRSDQAVPDSLLRLGFRVS